MNLSNTEDYIASRLSVRKKENTFRELKLNSEMKDFSSNDYLGIARGALLNQRFLNALERTPDFRIGSGGSRLLAGNDVFTENLENEIASFHQAESCLIFNSGYDANVGLFSSLPQKGDTIITDELIHASIIDGARLSHASRYIFKHNDCESLEKKLKLATGRIYIGVESIYSMDGDEAPLRKIALLAEKYKASLIVDEAHATGVFGNMGRGLVCEKELSSKIFARTITFGKALGTHGSAILGKNSLRHYLINFARSFIYTTAASYPSHLSVKLAYDYLKTENRVQSELEDRIQLFKNKLKAPDKLINSRSPIQAIIMKSVEASKKAAELCQSRGFDIRAILSPSVAPGKERVRICIHNHNSFEDIEDLCKILNSIL